ncbi:hypothetical protein OGAPHI_000509 [Ogataea philodendri]|uniref:Peroxisomal membrane protein PMP47B n=1 Tax=Ogataea philodendri TaxID=1378263 RepID=A0A9P8TAN9_9ASCO|nr:uncharacterized protein OGAPHI_000509 [Ogataea philodendri]KAH3671286.1 hypothetical protein OGAPHI_000509 [Ogataea philodendri]
MSKEVDSLAHGIAGGLGGLISMTLTYPLVTLSTKAQASTKKAKDPTISKEALKNLYNGLESALVGITATNFVYYYFYELTGSKLRRDRSVSLKKGLTATQSIVAGLVAGVISRVATNPIWIANTRLTVLKRSARKSAPSNTIQVILTILKKEGWRSLFSGLVPALFLVLNPIIQYTIFEQLKTLIVTRRKRKLSPFDALLLGAFGKLIATIVTYPYITVRSRMHLQNIKDSQSQPVTANSEASSNPADSVQSLPDDIESSSQLPDIEKPETPKKQGMVSLMYDIAKNEGIATFYNGLSLKLLQSILSAAFLFYFKEEIVLKTDYVIQKTKRAKRGLSTTENAI